MKRRKYLPKIYLYFTNSFIDLMDGVNMTAKELRLPESNVNQNPHQPQPHPLQLHHVLKHPYILHTGTILMYDYLEAEMKTKVNFNIPTFKTQRGQCQEHNFFEVSYHLYKYYYFYFFFFLLKVELKFSWLTRVLGDQYVEMDGESQRPWWVSSLYEVDRQRRKSSYLHSEQKCC